jgi:hypothetical protein
MFKKKTIFLMMLIFLVTSCADSWSNVKRGLTGAKQKSTDEFLVQKKDPLILPPDFDSLPSPSDRDEAIEEMSSFEKTFKQESETEITDSSAESSAEDSILKQIRKK